MPPMQSSAVLEDSAKSAGITISPRAARSFSDLLTKCSLLTWSFCAQEMLHRCSQAAATLDDLSGAPVAVKSCCPSPPSFFKCAVLGLAAAAFACLAKQLIKASTTRILVIISSTIPSAHARYKKTKSFFLSEACALQSWPTALQSPSRELVD